MSAQKLRDAMKRIKAVKTVQKKLEMIRESNEIRRAQIEEPVKRRVKKSKNGQARRSKSAKVYRDNL